MPLRAARVFRWRGSTGHMCWPDLCTLLLKCTMIPPCKWLPLSLTSYSPVCTLSRPYNELAGLAQLSVKRQDAAQSSFMNETQTFQLEVLFQATPGSGRGRVIVAGEARHLPNSGIQYDGDGDAEVAEGFGHFLTESDSLRTLEKSPGKSHSGVWWVT